MKFSLQHIPNYLGLLVNSANVIREDISLYVLKIAHATSEAHMTAA